MRLMHCALPLTYVARPMTCASNQPLPLSKPATLGLSGHSNVRMMRPSLDTNSTCFALSGKLSDVCAALEAMAATERLQAMRCAVQ